MILLSITLALFGDITKASDPENLRSSITQKPLCIEKPNAGSIRETFERYSIPDSEILARLVFAEGVSTNYRSHPNCKGKAKGIFTSIAWGVMNRVRMGKRSSHLQKRYGKGINGVIFKRGQFNPALSPRSRFAPLFLCPSNYKGFSKEWPLSRLAVREALSNQRVNPFLTTKWEKKNQLSLVSHFYYPLSTQATKKPPHWADTSASSKSFVGDFVLNGETISNRCIWFFRLETPDAIR